MGILLGGVSISKALGLARELTFAFAFGTTYVADAFRVALGAILIPTHLFTGEALFSAFIPAYKRLPGQERTELIRVVMSSLIALSVVVMVVLLALAPLLVGGLAPGFDAETKVVCASLIRVMAVGLIFYSVSALLINIQVSHDDYSLYSIRPSLQNLGILGAVVAAYALQAPILLGFGFVVSFVVLTAWALRGVGRLREPLRGVFRPSLRWPGQVTVDFRRALVQLSLFVVLTQLSATVDRVVGSLTGEGGVAALEYAFFITDSARFLIAVPLATLVLGRLGGLEWREARGAVQPALGVLLIGAIALSVLLWVAARELILLLYQRGQFQELSTELTAASLRGFAVGSWATTVAYVLQRLFNATLRNKEVAVGGAYALACNVALDLLLYRPMGVLGIALATSLSNIVMLFLLIRWSGFAKPLLRTVALPAVGVAALIIPLDALAASGIRKIVLATLALTIGAVILCVIWKPIRDDIAVLIEKVSAGA